MQPQDVPQEHHQEYATLLDQLHRFAQEIDAKLPMYMFVLKSEDMIKKLIAIVRLIFWAFRSFSLFIVVVFSLCHRFLLWDSKNRCLQWGTCGIS